MRRHGDQGLAILGWVIAVALASGCSTTEFRASAPGPGVPRLSNFRIEPREVERGGQVILRFDFRDVDGDIMDVYLGLRREIADFTFSIGLQPTLISHGRYFGQTEGTMEETITVSIQIRSAPLTSETRRYEGSVVKPERTQQEIGGIRVYEVFVIDRKEQVSNRVRARVTVR